MAAKISANSSAELLVTTTPAASSPMSPILMPTSPIPIRSRQEPPLSAALRYLWDVACADAAPENNTEVSLDGGIRWGAYAAPEIVANDDIAVVKREFGCCADPFHADWAYW
jgi:hypothetical protein